MPPGSTVRGALGTLENVAKIGNDRYPHAPVVRNLARSRHRVVTASDTEFGPWGRLGSGGVRARPPDWTTAAVSVCGLHTGGVLGHGRAGGRLLRALPALL